MKVRTIYPPNLDIQKTASQIYFDHLARLVTPNHERFGQLVLATQEGITFLEKPAHHYPYYHPYVNTLRFEQLEIGTNVTFEICNEMEKTS